MELTRATEGKTTFLVPMQDQDSQFPPSSAAVFFNRRMELNRDATVLLVSVLRPSEYLDAMGASGVRGLRVSNECNIPVTINDRNPKGIELIRLNARDTGREVEVVSRDANALLSERSFDAVDLDPFGTPATTLDAAVRGTRRYLFVTATDTAPLCGAHRNAGRRRYFANPVNTEYHREVGLRILLGFVVRETVKYDRGVEPIFSFAREHFIRLHLRLLRGARAADETLKRIGYVLQCPRCPYRAEQNGMFPAECACPRCSSPLVPVGPLWLGSIQSEKTLMFMREQVESMVLGTRTVLRSLIDLCGSELPTSSHFDYHLLSRMAGCSPPRIEVLLSRLADAGYPATRTHFNRYGFKTTAPLETIMRAVSAQG